MRRKQQESPFALVAFTIAAGFLIGCSVLIMNQLSRQVLPTTVTNAAFTGEIETFQADNLRLAIQVPQKYQKIIGTQNLTLISTDGRIIIDRTATNFDNLNQYLTDFDSKHTVQLKDIRQQQIDGYDAILRTEFYNNLNQELNVYYIYVDGWVYTFSTSDKATNSDLDQIVQSFHYTP